MVCTTVRGGCMERYKTNFSGWCHVVKYTDANNITIRFERTGNIKHHVQRSALVKGTVTDRIERYGSVGYYTDSCLKLSNQRIYATWFKLINTFNVCDDWMHFDEYTKWAIPRHSDNATCLLPYFYDATATNVNLLTAEYVHKKIAMCMHRASRIVDMPSLEDSARVNFRNPYPGYIYSVRAVQGLPDALRKNMQYADDQTIALRLEYWIETLIKLNNRI